MHLLKFADLLAGWKLVTNAKFQLNISKITPTRPKNTGTWDVNTTHDLKVWDYFVTCMSHL